MKDIDILQDILEYKISSETFYNNIIIYMRNPEARQLFIQMRDDEFRHIVKLQQKMERLKPANIIAKLIPIKYRY